MTSEVLVTEGFHLGKKGKIDSKIPGGQHFKIKLEDGKTTALKETEFKRISNSETIFNEPIPKGV